jgi:hypothetical protein
MLPVDLAMLSPVFPPDDKAQTSVHDKVSPLVQQIDVGQSRHFGYGCQRKNDDNCDDEVA